MSRRIGITMAIKEAVVEALENDRRDVEREQVSLEDRLNPLFDRWDRIPRSPVATDKAFFDELWGEE